MVGVLALQGNFSCHASRLEALGVNTKLITNSKDLRQIKGIILPGGESTTLLRLLNDSSNSGSLKNGLQEAIKDGLPTLATCAGLILLAKSVTGPKQDSLELLDVDVARNAYGRQIDSFITKDMRWTTAGLKLLGKNLPEFKENTTVEGVFIRAPRITRVGTQTEELICHNDEAVLIRQGNILGATFHPELSMEATIIHKLFMSFIIGL